LFFICAVWIEWVTHLLRVVLPHQLDMARIPKNVPAFVAGSPTGRMLSETIDICLNAKHIKEILVCITQLDHRNITFSKKFKKFLKFVAPVFTYGSVNCIWKSVHTTFFIFHSVLLYIGVYCNQTLAHNCTFNWNIVFHLKYFINSYKLRIITNCMF